MKGVDVLALPGTDGDEVAGQRLFRFTVLLAATMLIAWADKAAGFPGETIWWQSAAVALLVCLWSIFGRPPRALLFLYLAYAAAMVWFTFPATGNHEYLQMHCAALVAGLLTGRAADHRLGVQALRWLPIFVFFWSGIQKVVTGSYLMGDGLAVATAVSDRFEAIFHLIIPASEVAGLEVPSSITHPIGSYRLDAPLLVVVSNLVWVLEIAIPVALLSPRLRTWAAALALGMTWSLQIAAREVIFALLMTSLWLLFLPPAVARWAVYAYGGVAAVGLVMLGLGMRPW